MCLTIVSELVAFTAVGLVATWGEMAATARVQRGEKTAQIGLELATTLTIRQSTAPPSG